MEIKVLTESILGAKPTDTSIRAVAIRTKLELLWRNIERVVAVESDGDLVGEVARDWPHAKELADSGAAVTAHRKTYRSRFHHQHIENQ
jgi:hypothetical protein